MVLAVFLASIVSEVGEDTFKKTSKYIYLLTVIPAYIYFRNVALNRAALWLGLVLASFISALVAMKDSFG